MRNWCKHKLEFSPQTPTGLLCPVTGTHIATSCNTEQKLCTFLILSLFPLWVHVQGLSWTKHPKQDPFLSSPSLGCSTPPFPGSQTHRNFRAFHTHCPKSRLWALVQDWHLLLLWPKPRRSFILTTSKHSLSPCYVGRHCRSLQNPKMNQSQAYPDWKGN